MKRALLLIPLLVTTCSKEPPSKPVPDPSAKPVATASAPVSGSSASAASAAPPPSASAAPVSKDGEYAKNLAEAELSIADWRCSGNKPVKLVPPFASLVTFRCPENTTIKEMDVLANQGFALVGAGHLIMKGVQQMEVLKTPVGGMLHKVRDGKTPALVIHYSYWPLIPIPTGYRPGVTQEVTSVFEIVNDAWEEAGQFPREPTRGRLAGPKGPFVFPFDPLKIDVKVCRAADGKCEPNATTAFTPLELFEMWVDDSYVTDALDLAGPYRSKLTLAKAHLFAFAPKDGALAPSASAAAPTSAPPAPPAPSASPLASALPSAGVTKHPYEADDVEGCPLGLYRAAVESFVLSRLLNDAPDKVAEAADKVMAQFPMDACAPRVTGLPAWDKLRDKLQKLSEKPLSRQAKQEARP